MWGRDEPGAISTRKSRSYRVRRDFRFPDLNISDEEVLGQVVASQLAGTQGLGIVTFFPTQPLF
jgi:hypothetical protein